MSELVSLKIKSSSDAWKHLEALICGEYDETPVTLEFSNWPHLDINIKGERYNASLPSKTMRAFAEIQQHLNRTYSEIKYDSDARSLKKNERENLELLFTITRGSSDVNVNLTDFFTRLGDALSKKKTQNTVAIMLCVLALISETGETFRHLSDNETEIEIKNIELMEKALDEEPDIEDIRSRIDEAIVNVVLSAGDATQITVGTQVLNSEAIKKIATPEQKRIQKLKMSGEFYIRSLRKHKRFYSVLLEEHETEVKIKAHIKLNQFTIKELESLGLYLVSGKMVQLELLANVQGEFIHNASITKISS